MFTQCMRSIRLSQINTATSQCQIGQIGQTPHITVRNDMTGGGKDPDLTPGSGYVGVGYGD
jgi:hypothetical protein